MERKLNVVHRTNYCYSETVPSCCNLAVLLPRPLPWQTVVAEEIDVSPVPEEREEFLDSYGNRALFFRVDAPHKEFVVESRLTVSLAPRPRGEARLPWHDTVHAARKPKNSDDLSRLAYVYPSPMIQWRQGVHEYAQDYRDFNGSAWDLAEDLMHRIKSEFTFDTKATKVGTSVEELLLLKRGVCQDFSHFMIAVLRSLGLPARYASGYLETKPPPGKPKPIGADVSHAWVSVWDAEMGWLDLDPTNNLVVDTQHVTLAYGRDFGDVCPLKGVVEDGGQQTLRVSVDVRATE